MFHVVACVCLLAALLVMCVWWSLVVLARVVLVCVVIVCVLVLFVLVVVCVCGVVCRRCCRV